MTSDCLNRYYHSPFRQHFADRLELRAPRASPTHEIDLYVGGASRDQESHVGLQQRHAAQPFLTFLMNRTGPCRLYNRDGFRCNRSQIPRSGIVVRSSQTVVTVKNGSSPQFRPYPASRPLMSPVIANQERNRSL